MVHRKGRLASARKAMDAPKPPLSSFWKILPAASQTLLDLLGCPFFDKVGGLAPHTVAEVRRRALRVDLAHAHAVRRRRQARVDAPWLAWFARAVGEEQRGPPRIASLASLAA